MDDRIQGYRQPMVTATGIILGFVLNVASSWVRTESALPELLALAVFALFLAGITCLVVVLGRVLRMGVPPEAAEAYYGRTLALFLVGVSCCAVGILVDLLGSMVAG
ncbi:MAG: hypothetical protein U0S36_03755 [Candidatus Nanopelagicales bacterium]